MAGGRCSRRGWGEERLPGFASRRLRSAPAGSLLVLLLAGAVPRLVLLTDNRLHPDEALFASLARLIASGVDPLLAHTTLLVDKPPLFYYTLAAGVSIAWGSELTARLPGLFASLIGLALVARLAWQLWRSTALIYAFSPFPILFSPTTFADPLLVMWVLAALVAVTSGWGLRSRWGAAGLLLGLAAATKQSGLYFVPLVVALGIVRSTDARTRWRDVVGWLWPFAAGLGMILMLISGWNVLRRPAPGFWLAGVAANNPGRLARSSEVWPRALGWLGWLGYVGGSPSANAALAALVAMLLPLELLLRPRTREAACSCVLLAYALGYAAIHWLVAFPLIDRYVLPLAFMLALLAGCALSLLASAAASRFRLGMGRLALVTGLALGALFVSPVRRAVQSALPVGGDHGAYDGIGQVARLLRTLPEGSIVYYDSLGWSLTYYLFDAPIFLAPFDSPAALAADLQVFGGGGERRMIVLPGWHSHAEILDAVAQAGFRSKIALETFNRHDERSLVVYELIRAATPPRD